MTSILVFNIFYNFLLFFYCVYYNRTDFNTEVTKVGVIAQEVETVLPELILESPEDGLKSVAYSELTAVLINAVKEQQEIIEDLKTRIEQLEN